MSANNSDLGSLSGISTNTFSILQYTLNMNNLPTRSFSGSNNIQTYSFDESGSHSNSDLYTWPGVQNMFVSFCAAVERICIAGQGIMLIVLALAQDTAHDASKASESPLFGTEESLCEFIVWDVSHSCRNVMIDDPHDIAMRF